MCVVACFVAQVMHFPLEMWFMVGLYLSHSGAGGRFPSTRGALSPRGVAQRNQRHATRVVGPVRMLWAPGKPGQVFWYCCIVIDWNRWWCVNPCREEKVLSAVTVVWAFSRSPPAGWERNFREVAWLKVTSPFLPKGVLSKRRSHKEQVYCIDLFS